MNKQYSPEEYWKTVDQIKTKMLEVGEYGEFFPLKNSPHGYKDSSANIDFPLTKEQVLEKGWHWQDEVKSNLDLSKFKVTKAEDTPDDIKNVSDDILSKVILCEKTQKPFRITKFELDFYRRKNLSLPTTHPLERVKNLVLERIHPSQIYKSTCKKCNDQINTFYNPAKNLKVYCEQCYNSEVA